MSRPIDIKIHGFIPASDYESFIAKIAEEVGKYEQLNMDENYYE